MEPRSDRLDFRVVRAGHRSLLEGLRIVGTLWVVLGLMYALPHYAFSAEEEEVRTGYRVVFRGTPPEDELTELLQSVSDAYQFRDQPPATVGLLRRRAMNDVPALMEAYKSWGYFKAEVRVKVDEYPLTVTFTFTPGPLFLLHDLQVEPHSEPPPRLPTPSDIGLVPGTPFRARQVLDARARLLSRLGEFGHPFPRMIETDVVADHAANRVNVRFVVDPGPVARFGRTRVEGLTTVEEEHVRSLLPWKEGERFNQTLIERAREQLIRTGLFSLVEIDRGEALEEEDRLPMRLSFRERSHRTVRAGVNYTTEFGPGILLGWEHRNLYGSGEFLETFLSVNESIQTLDIHFQKPRFLREDQRFVARSTLAGEDTDAYKSRSVRNLLKVERDFTRALILGAGVGFDYLDVEETGQSDTFMLLSFPLSASLDTRDDILDPTRGVRFDLFPTPFLDLLGDHVSFFRYDLIGNAYFTLMDERRLVLAVRGRYGQILGESRARIPATERFYAGGGGSVRGFPFQSLSPLDDADDPIGGRSLVELSLELRSKITERFGLAAFMDGGRAYAGSRPDFGEGLYWGTGVGLRMYTPIGPIRLDVAFPLNKPDNVGDSFQFYISIGQAF
jgi:translocation and assembly module TamA